MVIEVGQQGGKEGEEYVIWFEYDQTHSRITQFSL